MFVLIADCFATVVQEYKRTAFLEADLQCSKVIQSMETNLRAACHAPDAKLSDVIQVSQIVLEQAWKLDNIVHKKQNMFCYITETFVLS